MGNLKKEFGDNLKTQFGIWTWNGITMESWNHACMAFSCLLRIISTASNLIVIEHKQQTHKRINRKHAESEPSLKFLPVLPENLKWGGINSKNQRKWREERCAKRGN